MEQRSCGGCCPEVAAGLELGYRALFCLQPVESQRASVTAAVCVVVVVVKVAGFHPVMVLSVAWEGWEGRGEARSPEQGGEFLDAAFTAPADV